MEIIIKLDVADDMTADQFQKLFSDITSNTISIISVTPQSIQDEVDSLELKCESDYLWDDYSS